MADHLGEGENYTRISNEILEALAKAKLNGTQHAICLVVWRYTFGFQRCEAKLSASFIGEAADINPRQVKRELQALADRKIILKVEQRDGVTSTLSFNKNIPSWQPVTKKTPVSKPVTNPSLALVTNQTPELVSNPSPKKQKKESNKENGSGTVAAIDFTPYQKIADLYHRLCPSLSKVVVISANRKIHIKARWEQYKQDLDTFIILFRKAEASAFMKGGNDRHWKADFDWMMNETNMAKVLEGKYDRENGRASPGRGNKETPEEALARISKELEDDKNGSEAGGYDNSENSSNLPCV